MDITSLYFQLASWIGWPFVFTLVVLISTIGYWILNNRISLIQEHKEYLEAQLIDSKSFQPDVVATRLAERHKHLTEVIELLKEDVQKNKAEIEERENELNIAKSNIIDLSEKLYNARVVLQNEYPRFGIVSPIVLSHLINELKIHGSIFLPVWAGWGSANELISAISITTEYYFGVFRGMSKFRLGLYRSESNFIGEIHNPFENNIVYDNDYHETLALLFSPFIQDSPKEEKNYLPTSIEFLRANNDLEDYNNLIVLKIPMNSSIISANTELVKEMSIHKIKWQ